MSDEQTDPANKAPSGHSETRRYDLKGVAFAAPAAWEERTVLALAAPSPSGAKTAPNLVLSAQGPPTSDVAPRAPAAFPLVPMPGTLRTPREV